MRKGYKLLSANHSTATMVADAIIKVKNIRVYSKKPCEELFKAFTNGIGTQAEANRIVQFLIDDRVIVKDGNRYKWNGDINHWNDRDWRRTYVLAMLLHSDDTKKPVLCKKVQSKKLEKSIESAIREKGAKEFLQNVEKKLTNLEKMSNDELENLVLKAQNILNTRKEKSEKVQSILDKTGLSKEEILEILK